MKIKQPMSLKFHFGNDSNYLEGKQLSMGAPFQEGLQEMSLSVQPKGEGKVTRAIIKINSVAQMKLALPVINNQL